MKRYVRVALVLAALLVCRLPAVMAQASESPVPAFEVISIKPNIGISRNSSLNFREGHFTTENVALRYIVQFAYGLNPGSSVELEAPDWIGAEKFDIDAKEDEDTAKKLEAMGNDERIAVLRVMARGLLQERFGLRAHFEQRKMRVMALVLAASGSKLKVSAPASAKIDASAPEETRWRGLHQTQAGQLEGRDASLEMLLNVLARQPEVGGQLVVNRTGLDRKYDFALSWRPQTLSAEPESQSDDSKPVLFVALQQELGLKLEPRQDSVAVLVVEHVERPSAN